MPFYEYRLTSPALCLGERVKAGLFRPCDTRTIRYSAITGALRQVLPGSVHAAGYLVQEQPNVQYWVYGPQDRGVGVSKLPITVQYLTNVEARVYVVAQGGLAAPPVLQFSMGALKSHGFGRCRMELLGLVDPATVPGRLQTRLPEDLAQDVFGVSASQPRYGYLFRPTSVTEGVYVRSLFEDSIVVGPACLVKEGADG